MLINIQVKVTPENFKLAQEFMTKFESIDIELQPSDYQAYMAIRAIFIEVLASIENHKRIQ